MTPGPEIYLPPVAAAAASLPLTGYYLYAFSGIHAPTAITLLVENRKWPPAAAALILAWSAYFASKTGGPWVWTWLFANGAFGAALVWLGEKRAMENRFPVVHAAQWSEKAEWNPRTLVLGVLADGASYAIPLALAAFHHIVEFATEDGRRLAATYCSLTGSASVFSARVGDKPARFSLGAPNHHNFLMRDDVSGSWWSQLTGSPVVARGARGKREPLERVPCSVLALDRWVQVHPGTLFVKPVSPPDYDWGKYLVGERSTGEDVPLRSLPPATPSRLNGMDWILGLFTEEGPAAVAFDRIEKEGVLEFELGEESFLVVYDAFSEKPAAFVKELRNASEMRFDPDPEGVAAAIDAWSESLLDYSGRFFKGPLTGKRLPLAKSTPARWYAWSRHFPDTKLIL